MSGMGGRLVDMGACVRAWWAGRCAMCSCPCTWAVWVVLVPDACLVSVPMGCAFVHAHGAVMDTYRDMHAGLVGCHPWAHANAMGMCRGHMWAVTWPCWAVVRVCLAPPWHSFGSLVARYGAKSGVVSRDVT